MLRAIVVTGLIAVLVTAGVFGSRMLHDNDGDRKSGNENAVVPCDLLEEGPCVWSTGSGDWKVTLSNLGEGVQGTEYRLTIETPERPERFLAVLRGESMYMGEYPVPLGKVSGNQYSARFTAPFCTVDATMTWRIDLQEGQEPISNIPVGLVFQAEPH
ncbi:hypothetical protein [Marinobacter sp. F3R08]|uniref:hypothetical protein n=1 Tax=Marinobacter sp. F3R08 TaxID=2841559 RepID=UPI001E2BF7BD|nr:hypothetical protein [Marinobacter sp. F3R08]